MGLSFIFYHLISSVVNESDASIVNPRNFRINLLIALCWILTPPTRWRCSLTPSPWLSFSHAKYTNGVLPLRCSWCIWPL